jgi:hypothetical protein
MSEQIKSDEEILSDLFSDMPLYDKAEISLPSGEVVKIKPITFEEEKLLINSAKNRKDPLNILIDRCVEGNTDDILFIDKIFILFKLREISFGNKYKFSITCPSCKDVDSYEVEIDKLPINPLEDSEPVKIKLPMCKKTVTVRRASTSDEKFIGDSDLLMSNLWRFVKDVEDISKKTIVSKFLERLPAGDVNTIIATVMCKGYGLQTEVGIKCNSCNASNFIELPLTKDFFTVS